MENLETILDIYLFESNSLLERLDEILISAEKQSGFSDDDINEIFRIMHTIKGSSAMMEFNSLMNVAHSIEDLFYYIRENGVNQLHMDELFDLMFDNADFLRNELSSVSLGQTLTDNIDPLIAKINDMLGKIKNKSDDIAPSSGEVVQSEKEIVVSSEPESGAFIIRVFFDPECGMENLRALMLINSIKEEYDGFTYQPSDIETNSDTARQIQEEGFTVIITNENHMDGIINIIELSSNVKEYKIEIIEADQNIPMTEEKPAELKEEPVKQLQEQIEKPQIKENKVVATQGAQSKQSLINVNIQKLDKLMDIVGEIVITESMVTSNEQTNESGLMDFAKASRQLRKLTNELQDIVMSIRMVPVSGVFQKMNRIVRDMDKKLGKSVELILQGEQTEVDKAIVDGIADPIMHLVRNSMDHGIESNVEERIAKGKDEKGTITLSARHTGSDVLISISDDGKGIDPQTILEKADGKGLLVKPKDQYSKREILNLLMLPGFSTKDKVTEYSGRGVGMDVVKKNIEEVGGTVNIDSEFGKGTTTTFKIPLTLAISSCMKVAVGDSIYAIPIMNIKQSFRPTKEDIIYDSNDNEIVKWLGEFYPVLRLHKVYDIATEKTELEEGILVLIEIDDNAYFVFVDDILGEQQVVVKPLPTYLSKQDVKGKGIGGCTILGDGKVSLILDVMNLYNLI